MKCVVCVWLGAAWVERGGEWMRGFGLGFTNPVRQGECWTCVCVWVTSPHENQFLTAQTTQKKRFRQIVYTSSSWTQFYDIPGSNSPNN